ncbi:MAG: NAD(P)-binding protein [Chitinivibrionales bacterium]|nr:NAD(P)-binding protein [Chitinivibrionales bacterium]
MDTIVVIGAGMAGLGVAQTLKQEGPGDTVCRIFEKETRPGGLCRTEEQDGFFFDYTGHLLHFRTDHFRSTVFDRLDGALQERRRSAWIYSKGVYTHYPFQAHLYGLPIDVVVDCVYEYSREYFREPKRPVVTFEDWIAAHFGDGIAAHFMTPYNTKIYRRPPHELSPDTTGRFVPSADLKQLLRGALAPDNTSLGYNATFYYPESGGIERLIRSLASGLDHLVTGESVVRIDPTRQQLTTGEGRTVTYDYLVSTQPIAQLVGMIDGAPRAVREAAARLSHVSVLNINLGISGSIGDRHWIYVPEPDILFHRIGFPSNFSDAMAPDGHSSMYLEISYDRAAGIDRHEALRRSVADLVRMGIIDSADRVVAEKTIDIPYAYVHFDAHRSDALGEIGAYLRSQGIASVGRFGAWEYSSMEDAYMQGVEAARAALRCLGERRTRLSEERSVWAFETS